MTGWKNSHAGKAIFTAETVAQREGPIFVKQALT